VPLHAAEATEEGGSGAGCRALRCEGLENWDASQKIGTRGGAFPIALDQ